MIRLPAVLVLAAALVAAAPVPAAAMPAPTGNVIVAVPTLQPLDAHTIPPESFAVIRDDAGAPFRFLRRDQFERFYRSTLSMNQQRTVSKVVDPVPPRFAACVSALRGGDALGTAGEPASDPARRRVCAALRETTRDTAALQLISLQWIVGEAGREGIAFTESRIHHERMTIAREQFKGLPGLRRFLVQSGYTSADIRLNIIAQLAQTALVRKIQERLGPAADDLDAESRAIDAFRSRFNAGWHARTACAPDFAALPACKSAPPG